MVTATEVPLDPPVTFAFIDKPMIASLVSQVEPDFIEKSRTETEKQRQGGKLSVGVASSTASAETGSQRDATHEFEKATATPERRTLYLIKYCVKTGRAALLRDRDLMVMGIVFPELQRRIVISKASLDDPIKPGVDEDPERQKKEIEALKENAEDRVDAILSAPPDLVLLAIQLSPGRSHGSSREYTGTVALKANTMMVRVLVPYR